ncbi:MAG: cytochrome c oxidase assembly protein [Mucilaginibacter sp.]
MEIKPIIYQWHIDLSVLMLTVAIFYFYFLVSRFKPHRRDWCFWVTVALFLLVECSPLQYLGMHAYFSAHMVNHVILLLLCGPLLVLSIPSKPTFRMLNPILILSAFFARHSWVSWLTGVGIMWLWHIPAIFSSSHEHNMLLHSGSLLLAGMVFSWPLFGPIKSDHIHALSGIIYLFTACISCSLLGLLITFAPVGTFHHDTTMAGMGINPLNITPRTDQQAAGLIMWVPCCLVYLSGCLYLLMRWFAEKAGNLVDEFSNLNHSLKEHDRK